MMTTRRPLPRAFWLLGLALPGTASALEIWEVQGATHTSPFVNQSVTLTGVVTAVDPFGTARGYTIQSENPDGDLRTSDGIYIFTGSTSPGVTVGQRVSVTGNVTEFRNSGRPTDLTLTQLTGATRTVLASGVALPPPVVLGAGGRPAPTSVIENDNFGSFDASSDGIDYWESLEGMRVTLPGAQVVQPQFSTFGEFYAVANQGAGATGMNSRGGITISASDANPERIQIDDDFQGSPFPPPSVNTGDRLGDVTGVVGYSFSAYELFATQAYTATSGGLQRETSAIQRAADRLTVSSFNVLNLDPGDGAAKFAGLAGQIVNNLNRPDIIALQEVQDNSGATNNGVVDASLTYQTLINAIAAAGGPTYAFADVAPTNNADGGEPGGNIRVGYLYDPTRVTLSGPVSRLPGADADPAFADSRKPLLASFEFNGETVTLINNHFASKGASSPLYGTEQPPVNGQEGQRILQAQFVNDYVDGLLSANSDLKLIVLGDLNEFDFEDALQVLEGTPGSEVLKNLAGDLPESERYSFIFDGNSQLLDHILVSSALYDGSQPLFDIVHVNAEFASSFSDHDPLLASFRIAGTVVPVPASAWLFLSAAGLLGGMRRRLRNSAEA